jgi:mannose-1-phosphate guanylyltransferase
MAALESVLILAGGRGERFWPWSRPDLPKQLLPLAGGQSLLEATLERVAGLAPPERTWILTARDLAGPVERAAAGRARVVAEPVGRNTAAATGLGARLALEHGAAGPMAVLPADHLIPDREAVLATARRALEVAGRAPLLVTLGIAPQRPETGYGYIERGEPLAALPGAFRVRTFREKPDAATAAGFLAAGGFYWNSGMFFWRPEVLLAALDAARPQLAAGLERLAGRLAGAGRDAALAEVYPGLESISVDYAVMESADNAAVLEAGFDWDDLGSWGAWARRQERDAAGNVAVGRALALDSEECVILGGESPVVVLGGKRLIVVQRPGGTLVCPLERAEDVRRVLAELERRGWS